MKHNRYTAIFFVWGFTTTIIVVVLPLWLFFFSLWSPFETVQAYTFRSMPLDQQKLERFLPYCRSPYVADVVYSKMTNTSAFKDMSVLQLDRAHSSDWRYEAFQRLAIAALIKESKEKKDVSYERYCRILNIYSLFINAESNNLVRGINSLLPLAEAYSSSLWYDRFGKLTNINIIRKPTYADYCGSGERIFRLHGEEIFMHADFVRHDGVAKELNVKWSTEFNYKEAGTEKSGLLTSTRTAEIDWHDAFFPWLEDVVVVMTNKTSGLGYGRKIYPKGIILPETSWACEGWLCLLFFSKLGISLSSLVVMAATIFLMHVRPLSSTWWPYTIFLFFELYFVGLPFYRLNGLYGGKYDYEFEFCLMGFGMFIALFCLCIQFVRWQEEREKGRCS